MKVLISTENMSRQEWLQWRNKGIGGSDASIICGINKYKSPVELWMDKTGMAEPVEAGEAAYWGTMIEPLIRDEFTRRTGLRVSIEKSMFQHPDYPFMLANVDGIVNDDTFGDCIFEAKTSSIFRQNEWDDSIPEEYQLQVQHYMAVTGLKGAYVAVLMGGNQYKYQFIPRDEELIQVLIKLENLFWQFVQTKTPPPMDGSKSCSDFLSRFYPDSKPTSSISLPEEALTLIKQYEEYEAKEKEVALIKEEAANKLKNMLGDNESGLIIDRKITWKTMSSERLDSKTLKLDHPEIYKNYTYKSTFRRFSLK